MSLGFYVLSEKKKMVLQRQLIANIDSLYNTSTGSIACSQYLTSLLRYNFVRRCEINYHCPLILNNVMVSGYSYPDTITSFCILNT